MKPDKAEIALEFNKSSNVFIFPDLFQHKKLNIQIGMGSFIQTFLSS